MNLGDVLRVLRERRLIILSCLLLGLLGAGVATRLMPEIYSAQVTMFVAGSPQVPPVATTPPAADTTAGTATVAPTAVARQPDSVYQANQLAQDRMASYVQLLTSDRITAPVTQELDLGVQPGELADNVSVTNVPNTVVLTVAVTDEEPERAAQIANAVAEQFVGLVAQLETQSGSNQISVVILQPAAVPNDPISPRPVMNLALGACLGLLLGLVGAFFRDALDTTFRSRGRLAGTTGAPTLGAIPFVKHIRGQPLIVAQRSRTGMAEAFRQLRTNLYFNPGAAQTSGAHHTLNGTVVNVVVTSSVPGEGTTSTVCNLAIAAADAGRTVLVIDANLRSGVVSELFQLDPGPGLADVLIGDATLARAVQTWRKAATVVDVLPSGGNSAGPSELLSGRVMIDLLAKVRSRYDLVLIDTPPLLPFTDPAAVAPHTDGVLLVVRYGRTTAAQVETATAALKAVSGPLLGTVISMVPRRSPWIRLEMPKRSRTGIPVTAEKTAAPHETVTEDAASAPTVEQQPERQPRMPRMSVRQPVASRRRTVK